MRMLVSQGKDFLLLAMGFGGILRVNMSLTTEPPTFTSHEGLHALVPLQICRASSADHEYVSCTYAIDETFIFF